MGRRAGHLGLGFGFWAPAVGSQDACGLKEAGEVLRAACHLVLRGALLGQQGPLLSLLASHLECFQ